jgi:hypothetical protein
VDYPPLTLYSRPDAASVRTATAGRLLTLNALLDGVLGPYLVRSLSFFTWQ